VIACTFIARVKKQIVKKKNEKEEEGFETKDEIALTHTREPAERAARGAAMSSQNSS
jgi:hypothetical protein